MKISTSSAIYRWKPASWLRVTGEDAANFLQGQFTNELRKLAPGEAAYGLWLTVKGKVLADSFVIRGKAPVDTAQGGVDTPTGAGEYWVGSYFSSATTIRERLEAFIIADDVVIEDVTGHVMGISVFAESEAADPVAAIVSPAVGDAPGVPFDTSAIGLTFSGRRGRGGNVEWVFPTAQAEMVEAILGRAGLREVTPDEMEARRIADAIPAIPTDIGPGDLPGEGALEDDAISYTKGCYLGQEVMARLKSMGQVRRRLLRVAGAGDGPAKLPAELFIGPRKVGELRSAARHASGGWTGLAMLSLMHVSAEATLAFTADGAPAVRLVDAP